MNNAGPAPRGARKRRSTEPCPSAKKVCSTAPASSRVNVAVRVRPATTREGNAPAVVRVVDDRCLVFDPKVEAEPFYFQGQKCGGLKKDARDATFIFDKVFDETKDNIYVFENTTKEMLDTLLDGCNCSVFAYGATGAGKTYTMLGSEDCPGVVWHTANELYARIERLRGEGQSCDVAVAYLEVYNENLRDLLCPATANPPHHLTIRDDPAKGIVIGNLSIHKVTDADSLLSLLHKGNRSRTQHPTDANSESSRSHAIFQLYVTRTENVSGTSKGLCVSKMSFVDLAGSERAAAVSKNVAARLREGTKINLSLMALGKVVDALANNWSRVPYRDSKLTYILKDSLGGSCRTLMIAAVSPSTLSYHNTFNTLKYAERATKIQLQAKRNVVSVNMHVSMYGAVVEEYKKKVEVLTAKLKTSEEEKANLAARLEAAESKSNEDYTSDLEARLKSALENVALLEGQLRQKVSADAIAVTPPEPVFKPPTQTRVPRLAEECLEAAHKIYNYRATLVHRLYQCETGLRSIVLKVHHRKQLLKTHSTLLGEQEKLMDMERSDAFLKNQGTKRQQLLELREDLMDKLRRNSEGCQGLLRKAEGDCCLQAIQSEVVRLQSELEKTEASCWASLLAHLCELLSSNCGHWEELNGRSLPHLRELTDIFEGRNYMDSNLRNTYNGIVKQAKGRSVNWADERVAREGCGPLDIARVLEFPAFVTSAAAPETGGSEPYCPALASAMPAVEEEGEEEEEPAGENAFECYEGNSTFVRFPRGSPHPRPTRMRRSHTPEPVAPSSPAIPCLEATFVMPSHHTDIDSPCATPQGSLQLFHAVSRAPLTEMGQRTSNFGPMPCPAPPHAVPCQTMSRFGTGSRENTTPRFRPVAAARAARLAPRPTPCGSARPRSLRRSLSTSDVGRSSLRSPAPWRPHYDARRPGGFSTATGGAKHVSRCPP